MTRERISGDRQQRISLLKTVPKRRFIG
jgi:hypothetical protein